MKYLKALQSFATSPETFGVGVMSGTSADAVDAALVKFSGHTISLEKFHSLPYEPQLRDQILNSSSLNVAQISDLNFHIARTFARCVELLDITHIRAPLVIGSHGQTVFHHSRSPDHISTLQLGSGDIIAAHSNAFVVSDFRVRDMAHGGEGAPLTPYADKALYKHCGDVIVCNIGGISNVSVLSTDTVLGFDVGPGNAPLDRLAKIFTNGQQEFDKNGDIARSGKVDKVKLKKLISEDFFVSLPPPKSTGTESYGDTFVNKLLGLFSGNLTPDLLSTATEFVAVAIKENIKSLIPSASLILAGGGAKNSFLVERIKAHCSPRDVILSESCGVPSHARECMAFAILARDFVLGKNTSLPSVTGARCSAPLGKLSLPHNFNDFPF